MQLYKFAAAKIAAVPLMFMYVFIGASTDMLISGESEGEAAAQKTSKKISVDDETHRKMVLLGLCLSVVSISLVSHFVKKELNKVGPCLSVKVFFAVKISSSSCYCY